MHPTGRTSGSWKDLNGTTKRPEFREYESDCGHMWVRNIPRNIMARGQLS